MIKSGGGALEDQDLELPGDAAVAMDEDGVDKDIWIGVDGGEDNRNNTNSILDDVNDASIFYTDFPPLPEFPCMSSSSSSSPSTPAVHATVDPIPTNPEGSSLGDIDQVMENLSYIDLIDTTEIWDPSSVFQSDNPSEVQPPPQAEDDSGGLASFLEGNSELAAIFFEWLKQNRNNISAEDMRTIKLRRSTIESATKRLGTNKEGKKQLLKLILEWVEHHQLQKRRASNNYNTNPNPNNLVSSPYNPLTPDPNSCFSPAPWAATSPQMYSTPMGGGYNGVETYPNPNFMPKSNQFVNVNVNGIIPYQHTSEYSAMDPARSWPMMSPQYNPYPDNGNMANNQFQSVYGNPYQVYDPNGERLVSSGAAATKEARQRRMAHQRRMHSSHHHNRHGGNSSNRYEMQTRDASHNVCDGGGEDGEGSEGNFGYWSGTDGVQPATGDQNTVHSDRRQRQGWKPEKNFKFLLQKVLKQSDVGNLGRIVLPKKEAESHLPELETRDGITIAMEDIVTARVWNIRYRFWPNNKSRMYILENTGDFVRANGLQEGDFIVLYLDTRCHKYMIRGVKVRELGTKSEVKKPARRNTRNVSVSGNTSSSPVPSEQGAS